MYKGNVFLKVPPKAKTLCIAVEVVLQKNSAHIIYIRGLMTFSSTEAF